MDHLLSKTLNGHSIHTECDALIELATDYEADVVVDAWNPFACIAARVLQKPLVSIIQADMHPDSRGFIWWKNPPPKLPTAVPIINKALSRYCLAPVRKTEEFFVGDLTLVVGMPETDPLPDAANVVYIGPMLWQKTAEGLPDWVNTLSRGKPVIWVYSGNPKYAPVRSPVDSLVVLQACITALADEDVQVVLTTGHHPLPKRLLPLPANFHYALFVPGLDMAKRSDVLIHHGGYGSCQTGLYVGTPAVIIPTYSERESNARRVAAVGAGEIVLPTEGTWGKKYVDVEELRTKVRSVLSDLSYKENAIRISAKMQAYGGASAAARLIEDCSVHTVA